MEHGGSQCMDNFYQYISILMLQRSVLNSKWWGCDLGSSRFTWGTQKHFTLIPMLQRSVLNSKWWDVILATVDSPWDSETFYIERNNTMLHIRLLNGTYMQVFLLLSISFSGMTVVGHCDVSDVIKNNQLDLQNHQET
jgi:hypothetical protein